jgi:CBS-domain-containing membrane protein
MLKSSLAYLGIEPDNASHREKIVSGIGGFIGIFAILFVSAQVTAGQDLPLIVASMGASAVLLFAAPHGKLSQPWNLIGGHLVSALIGVACARWITDTHLAAALAVGLAITAMYYLRCIHPPGGATALMAVIGGPQIHALGFDYVLMPVGLNVLIILLAALALNYLTVWRRYPAHLHRRLLAVPVEPNMPVLHSSDFDYALRRIGSYVDVTYEELETIYRLAEHHAQTDHVPVESIRLGHYYSNGKYGAEWAVRQVVDEGHGEGDDVLVIYKTVAGNGRRSSGSCSRIDFARWSKHEVYLNESSWLRVP